MELVNIAYFGKGTQSSVSKWSKPNESQLILQNNNNGYSLHTEKDEQSWFQVEFPFDIKCYDIVIHNRRDLKFCHVSNNISVLVSLDGENWKTVYNKIQIFGWDKDALHISFKEGENLKYIKFVNKNNYLHLAQIEILVNKEDNRNITLITDRQDGLCQRLLGMINAMAVADYCGFNFGFTWLDNKSDNSFHDVKNVYSTFNDDFIRKFYFNIERKENINVLKYGDIYLTPDASLIVNKNEYIDYRKFYDNIDFSEEIKFSISHAKKLSQFFKSDFSAIHIRAGDIVYGVHRKSQQFITKVLQYPFILDLLNKENNKNILLVGQDISFMQVLERNFGSIKILENFYPKDLTSIQKIFFDVECLSSCSEIYGGDSGPILLASKLSGSSIINRHIQLPLLEKLDILKFFILDDNFFIKYFNPNIISYACSAYLYYGFNKKSIPIENLIRINNLAMICDQETEIYKIFDLLLQYRCLPMEMAEKNVRNYIEQYGTSTSPIKGLSYLYNSNWKHFSYVSNRVGYLNDIKEKISNNFNLPYAEFIIGMSEYNMGNKYIAKKYFNSLKNIKNKESLPKCLSDFFRSLE